MTEEEQVDVFAPQRSLVISAHPDDPEFGAGGIVARWCQSGTEVTYVIVTDGSKGSGDPEIEVESLVRRRQEEQLAAARVLGVGEVVFLEYPDGSIFDRPELRRALARQIRRHRPEVLVTHDPTARIIGDDWINHPDHLAVGESALSAAFPLARDPLNFPEHRKEGLEPHKVRHILLTPTDQPNLVVDVTATLDTKIAAIREHRSQIQHYEELETRMRDRARSLAEGTSFEFGEAFRYVRLRR